MPAWCFFNVFNIDTCLQEFYQKQSISNYKNIVFLKIFFVSNTIIMIQFLYLSIKIIVKRVKSQQIIMCLRVILLNIGSIDITYPFLLYKSHVVQTTGSYRFSTIFKKRKNCIFNSLSSRDDRSGRRGQIHQIRQIRLFV